MQKTNVSGGETENTKQKKRAADVKVRKFQKYTAHRRLEYANRVGKKKERKKQSVPHIHTTHNKQQRKDGLRGEVKNWDESREGEGEGNSPNIICRSKANTPRAEYQPSTIRHHTSEAKTRACKSPSGGTSVIALTGLDESPPLYRGCQFS